MFTPRLKSSILRLASVPTIIVTLVAGATPQFAAALANKPFLSECLPLLPNLTCLEAINELDAYFLDKEQLRVINQLSFEHQSERVRQTAKDILDGKGNSKTRWIDELAADRARADGAEYNRSEPAVLWAERERRIERMNPKALTAEQRKALEEIVVYDRSSHVRYTAHVLLLGGATGWAKRQFNLRNRTWQQKVKDGFRSCVDFLSGFPYL